MRILLIRIYQKSNVGTTYGTRSAAPGRRRAAVARLACARAASSQTVRSSRFSILEYSTVLWSVREAQAEEISYVSYRS
jgi:hypothetical protein